MHKMTIREAQAADTTAVRMLVEQLGYPEDEPTIAARMAALQACGGRLLLAVRGDEVIGLAALDCTRHLHRAPDGRLTALVVAASARGQGVGKELLTRAEAVFREWGCKRVELSSGAKRRDAHRFYEREDYVESPKRFLKNLS
jgi:GNAT superfamily N-acetyltransferase